MCLHRSLGTAPWLGAPVPGNRLTRCFCLWLVATVEILACSSPPIRCVSDSLSLLSPCACCRVSQPGHDAQPFHDYTGPITQLVNGQSLGLGSCHAGNLATFCHLVGSTLVHSMSAFSVCTISHSALPHCLCPTTLLRGVFQGPRLQGPLLFSRCCFCKAGCFPHPEPCILRMIVFCHKHNCCVSSPSEV